MIIEERAFARAGLLGNPSDGYFGKTISVSIRNFGAYVELYQTPELQIIDGDRDKNMFRNLNHMCEEINSTGYYGGTRLVKAAIKTFTEYCKNSDIKLENKNFSIRYQTSIPRQVGMAGSSAIITATFKALLRFYNIEIKQEILPSLILSAERDELGINAGLQDRVIQVYGGCVYMDFEKSFMEKNGYGQYEQLDVKDLPNLFLAYKTSLSKVSGTVLNNIKQNYDAGDKKTIDTLQQIAQCAEDGKKAIELGDFDTLYNLMDKNFDLRCEIMNVSESNIELVQTARKCGASVKLSGSGGAIIGFYKDDRMLKHLMVELKNINARVIKPYLF